jgi:hypothetical protein
LRDKLQIIKSTAFTLYHPSKWFDDLEVLVNTIDNELRPERNRMMHDVWERGDPDSALIMISATPKIRRIQSQQQRILYRDRLPISQHEIWNFCNRVLGVAMDFGSLIYRIPRHASQGKSP